jgi:lysine 2,3-aminomutase
VQTFTDNQRRLAKTIEKDATRSHWSDWKWHVRNSVKSIDEVERLLGIRFPDKERRALEQTTEKFPMAITPYYLSLVDTNDWRNDPIFMQAFPSVNELRIENHDMSDPLHEDADARQQHLRHVLPPLHAQAQGRRP